MAKKSATAGAMMALAAVSTPQSTELEKASLNCALKDFFPYAKLAWRNCEANLDKFAGESERFTPDFIAAQFSLIEATENLPNNESRVSEANRSRLGLQAAYQEVFSLSKRLRTAIDYAFKL